MTGHHCFYPMKGKEKYNRVHALCELMGNLKVFLVHQTKLEGLSDTAQGIQGSRSSYCCSPYGNPFTLDATKPGDCSPTQLALGGLLQIHQSHNDTVNKGSFPKPLAINIK